MENNENVKKEVTMDDLARMVQAGFLNIDEKFKKFEKGQEEIKISVDNIEANINKKVDKVTHNTLEYRVEKLEKHAGLVAA